METDETLANGLMELKTGVTYKVETGYKHYEGSNQIADGFS